MINLLKIFKQASAEASEEIERTSNGMHFKEDGDICIEAGIKAVLAAHSSGHVYTLSLYKPSGNASPCSCCTDWYDSEHELLVTKDRSKVVELMAYAYKYNESKDRKGSWYTTLLIDGVACSSFDTDYLDAAGYNYDEFYPETDDTYQALRQHGDDIGTEAYALMNANKVKEAQLAKQRAEVLQKKMLKEKEEQAQRAAELEHETYLKLKDKFEGTLEANNNTGSSS